jgi:hypothetical protein
MNRYLITSGRWAIFLPQKQLKVREMVLLDKAGHSGSLKFSSQIFWVLRNLSFRNYYPIFVLKKDYPRYRVPKNLGLGSGIPELPKQKKSTEEEELCEDDSIEKTTIELQHPHSSHVQSP